MFNDSCRCRSSSENPSPCDPQDNETIWGDTTETGEVDGDVIIDDEIDTNDNEGMNN